MAKAQERTTRAGSAREAAKDNRTSRQTAAQTQEAELQDAIKNIPWSEISSEAKKRIKPVVSQHSIYRRMPYQAVYSDPEMYQYLLEHPDVVVGLWEQLGITSISLKEIEENRFLMKETTGTTAVVEVLYRTKDICIVYAKGQYKGPFLARSYDGEVVLALHSRFSRDEENEPFVVCKLDAFVRIDNIGADFLAKLFYTTLGKIADSNFEQTVTFVGHVSDAAGINSGNVKKTSGQIKSVRQTVLDDFTDVVDRVAMRSARREVLRTPQMYAVEAEPVSPYAVSYTPQRNIAAQTISEHPAPAVMPTMERRQVFAMPEPPKSPASESVETGCPNWDSEETETVVSAEKTNENAELSVPIPIGVSTLGEEPLPKSRAVFGTPKIVRDFESH